MNLPRPRHFFSLFVKKRHFGVVNEERKKKKRKTNRKTKRSKAIRKKTFSKVISSLTDH